MRVEWTAQRMKTMKRNASIVARNKFITEFNAMFGERRPLLPLEELPEHYRRTSAQSGIEKRPV